MNTFETPGDNHNEAVTRASTSGIDVAEQLAIELAGTFTEATEIYTIGLDTATLTNLAATNAEEAVNHLRTRFTQLMANNRLAAGVRNREVTVAFEANIAQGSRETWQQVFERMNQSSWVLYASFRSRLSKDQALVPDARNALEAIAQPLSALIIREHSPAAPCFVPIFDETASERQRIRRTLDTPQLYDQMAARVAQLATLHRRNDTSAARQLHAGALQRASNTPRAIIFMRDTNKGRQLPAGLQALGARGDYLEIDDHKRTPVNLLIDFVRSHPSENIVRSAIKVCGDACLYAMQLAKRQEEVDDIAYTHLQRALAALSNSSQP